MVGLDVIALAQGQIDAGVGQVPGVSAALDFTAKNFAPLVEISFPRDVDVGEADGGGRRAELSLELRREELAVDAGLVELEGAREARQVLSAVVVRLALDEGGSRRVGDVGEAVRDRERELRAHAAARADGLRLEPGDAERAEPHVDLAPVAGLELARRRGARVRIEVGGSLEREAPNEDGVGLDARAGVEAAEGVFVDGVLAFAPWEGVDAGDARQARA